MKIEIGIINVEWLRERVDLLTREAKKSEENHDNISEAAFLHELRGYKAVLEHVTKLNNALKP